MQNFSELFEWFLVHILYSLFLRHIICIKKYIKDEKLKNSQLQ